MLRVLFRQKLSALFLRWGLRLAVEPEEAAKPASGPPQHWLDLVKSKAPQLLEGARLEGKQVIHYRYEAKLSLKKYPFDQIPRAENQGSVSDGVSVVPGQISGQEGRKGGQTYADRKKSSEKRKPGAAETARRFMRFAQPEAVRGKSRQERRENLPLQNKFGKGRGEAVMSSQGEKPLDITDSRTSAAGNHVSSALPRSRKKGEKKTAVSAVQSGWVDETLTDKNKSVDCPKNVEDPSTYQPQFVNHCRTSPSSTVEENFPQQKNDRLSQRAAVWSISNLLKKKESQKEKVRKPVLARELTVARNNSAMVHDGEKTELKQDIPFAGGDLEGSEPLIPSMCSSQCKMEAYPSLGFPIVQETEARHGHSKQNKHTNTKHIPLSNKKQSACLLVEEEYAICAAASWPFLHSDQELPESSSTGQKNLDPKWPSLMREKESARKQHVDRFAVQRHREKQRQKELLGTVWNA